VIKKIINDLVTILSDQNQISYKYYIKHFVELTMNLKQCTYGLASETAIL